MTVEKLKLPLGRVVGGSLTQHENKKNQQTKQDVIDPATGQPVKQWRIHLAIPKAEFFTHVWPKMTAEAMTAYPNWQQLLGQDGLPLPQSQFSWKWNDGDSPLCPQGSQVPYNKREGYPGNIVMTLKTEAFPPKVFKFENGAFKELLDGQCKVGDYIVANVNMKVHTNNHGGLYINPNGYELIYYGPQIVTGGAADPNQLFGNQGNQQQYALPPGASATPMSSAPAGAQIPGMPVTVGNVPVPQGMPQPGVAPGMPMAQGMPPMQPGYGQPAMPTASPSSPMPAPAHDFVQNAGNVPYGVPGQAASMPQPGAPQPGYGAAPSAYPTNPAAPGTYIPGMPQAR